MFAGFFAICMQFTMCRHIVVQSAADAVIRVCLAECLSHSCIASKQLLYVLKLSSPSGSHIILVFPYETFQRGPHLTSLTAAPIVGGVLKNRDFRPIFRFISEIIQDRAIVQWQGVMTLSDHEWLIEIFNDTKHRAASLRQLSFSIVQLWSGILGRSALQWGYDDAVRWRRIRTETNEHWLRHVALPSLPTHRHHHHLHLFQQHCSNSTEQRRQRDHNDNVFV